MMEVRVSTGERPSLSRFAALSTRAFGGHRSVDAATLVRYFPGSEPMEPVPPPTSLADDAGQFDGSRHGDGSSDE